MKGRGAMGVHHQRASPACARHLRHEVGCPLFHAVSCRGSTRTLGKDRYDVQYKSACMSLRSLSGAMKPVESAFTGSIVCFVLVYAGIVYKQGNTCVYREKTHKVARI